VVARRRAGTRPAPTVYFLALLASWLSGFAYAAPQFPALNGRVVDEANLLSASARAQITQLSEQHERATTTQVVVVTVNSLQGYPIEDYGYQLGRHWGIGQQGKNNGVLLIVAPHERAVRIEVGYGLEGALTDALSSNIIQSIIIPRFKRGDFEGGIVAGTQAVVAALAGEYTPEAKAPESRPTDGLGSVPAVLFIVAMIGQFFAMLFSRVLGGVVFATLAGAIAWFATSSVFIALVAVILVFLFVTFAGRGGGLPGGRHGRGGFGGGFGGGGFRGGGGSFGGGGASGRW
jgi:uncharacterized protein